MIEDRQTPSKYPKLVFLDFITYPEDTRNKLLAAEQNRVQFYIENYRVYLANGYYPLLPPKIRSVIENTNEALKLVQGAVTKKIDDEYDGYASLSRICQQEWEELLKDNLWGITQDIMGPLSFTTRTLVPTAWGMSGSDWGKGTTAYDEDTNLSSLFGDGIIFIRLGLTENYEDVSLERKRFLIHEFIGHTVTVGLRADTPIDENIQKCSHQPDKEWLADEITAQIMHRMGYYPNLGDVPRQSIGHKAQDTTKKAFYGESFIDLEEPQLKYPGRINLVIQEAVENLKTKEAKSDQ